MSEIGDTFKALKEHRNQLKEPCPGCREKRPKAHPKGLMPGQKCPVCGYRDPRNREDS